MMANKNIIIIIIILVLVIIIAIGGYLYWRLKINQLPAASLPTSSINSAVNGANTINQSASQGVLPSIGGAANPIGTSSNLNPTNQTNPFNSIKTNPFQ